MNVALGFLGGAGVVGTSWAIYEFGIREDQCPKKYFKLRNDKGRMVAVANTTAAGSEAYLATPADKNAGQQIMQDGDHLKVGKLCLVAKENKEGSPLILQTCTTANNHKWRWENNSTRLKTYGGFCLEASANREQAKLTLEDCDESTKPLWNQKFTKLDLTSEQLA